MAGVSPHRTGIVAIGGRPNVGKSTLVNRIMGRKIAAVTPLPQTTRRRILGVRQDSDADLILIDTPGIHTPRRLINERMVRLARKCLNEGEVVAGVVEAANALKPGDREFLAEFNRGTSERNRPRVIAINKIDLIRRARLLLLAEQCAELAPGAEIVPVSAMTGENVDELVRVVKRMLPAESALRREGEVVGTSERTIAEEIIGEKIFLFMQQEIPFSTAVKVEEFVWQPERNLLKIAASIIAERESHKGMLIGAAGAKLKEVGRSARLELEQMFGSQIFLKLSVRVDENWTRDPRKLTELGL